jgi:hypothetical protein
MFCRTGGVQQSKTTLLTYFKKTSEEPPTDTKTSYDDPVNADFSSVMPKYLYFIAE